MRRERKEYKRTYYQRNKERIKKRVKVTGRLYRQKNKEKLKKKLHLYRQNLKITALKHYSPKLVCSKCGFSDIRGLQIDHINGNGTKHRKKIGLGRSFYLWLIKNNFPKGFQVLCANCNWIKRYENNEFKKVGEK